MRYFKYILDGGQTTIKKPFALEGVATFSGKRANIECCPLGENEGVIFCDSRGRKIQASYKNVKKSKIHSYTTELSDGYIRITSVEHILSAFYGLGVDNVLIKITEGEELPIFDSSSLKISEKIIQAGIIKLKGKRKVLKILRNFVVNDRKSNSLAIMKPYKTLKIDAAISFDNIIGFQNYTFNADKIKNYLKEISPARSFLIEPFNKDRWVIIRNKLKALPKSPLLSDIIIYNESEFITNLRFKDEPIRHKILDFLGDLSLLGYRVKGEIFVYRPGHSFTRKIVKEVINKIKAVKK